MRACRKLCCDVWGSGAGVSHSVVHLLSTCCAPAVHLLSTCCPPVVHLLSTCCAPAVHLLYPCCPPVVHLLSTCCTPAVHLLYNSGNTASSEASITVRRTCHGTCLIDPSPLSIMITVIIIRIMIMIIMITCFQSGDPVPWKLQSVKDAALCGQTDSIVLGGGRCG